jgi:hypothetical protein
MFPDGVDGVRDLHRGAVDLGDAGGERDEGAISTAGARSGFEFHFGPKGVGDAGGRFEAGVADGEVTGDADVE